MAQIIALVDDFFHAQGKSVPADHTVRLVLDEQAVELDLTTTHLEELDEFLAPYFKVGRSPAARTAARGKGTRVQNRAYNTRMRAWADARGIKYRDSTGKVNYPAKLKREFAAYLAERGETVTAAR